MPKIAISYRRSDGSSIAGRIYDWLAARYGADSVFMDVEKIPLGVDFRAYVKSVVLQSDVMLAIVGQRWCVAGAGQNRFADPEDPVRVEIEAGLQYGVRIIPVLIDGASMPAVRDLPESMKAFPFLNGTWIDGGRDFRPHMERLIAAIDGRESGVHAVSNKARGSAVPFGLAAPTARPNIRRIAWSAFAALAVIAGASIALLPRFNQSSSPPPAPVELATDRTVPVPNSWARAPTGSADMAPTGGLAIAPVKTYRVVSPISDNVLNLRAAAGARIDNPPIVAIPAGSPGINLGSCRRLDDGEPWCEATWRNLSGWLNARYLLEVDTTIARAGSANPAPDKVYQVANGIAGGILHIRRAPNTGPGNPPFASIPEGTSGIRLGPCLTVESAKWCLATWEGRLGWINERFLVPADVPPS